MGEQNINAGRDIHVGGDFVVADQIRNSFNKVWNSSANDEMKDVLRQLGEAIQQLAASLPDKDAKDATEEYDRLNEEAAKTEPKKSWLRTTLDNLKEIATTVGTVGTPVLDLIAKAKVIFGL